MRLAGFRVGGGAIPLIFAHGFLGSSRKRRVVEFVERLDPWFTVYVYDSRGHGSSGGVSTYGDTEFLDVEAVAELARNQGDGRVVTMGISMGAIAVVRQAAYRERVSCVVAISCPARWEGHNTRAIRRTRLVTETGPGRRIARAFGVRLTDIWNDPEDPVEVVGRIAPTPLVVVHGRDDHFFGEANARALYEAADEPKRLLLAHRFGHGEDGLTPGFAERISRHVYELLGSAWTAPPG